jgi:hypothetical protein
MGGSTQLGIRLDQRSLLLPGKVDILRDCAAATPRPPTRRLRHLSIHRHLRGGKVARRTGCSGRRGCRTRSPRFHGSHCEANPDHIPARRAGFGSLEAFRHGQ